jgi:hypothetical protein
MDDFLDTVTSARNRRASAERISRWERAERQTAQDIVAFYQEQVGPTVGPTAGAAGIVVGLLRDGLDAVTLKSLALAYSSYAARQEIAALDRPSAAAFYGLLTRGCVRTLALVLERVGTGEFRLARED